MAGVLEWDVGHVTNSFRGEGQSDVLMAVFSYQFSRDQFILECPSEKLRKELEEELKMDGEELRSHAWYHGAIPRQVRER